MNKSVSKFSIDLNKRVSVFVKWYYRNMVEGNYTSIGEYNYKKRMYDFIEKMAVWYELRYPDYEVNKLMYCCGYERNDMNRVMFKNNPYVNDLVDEGSDIRGLDWPQLYNANVFIDSLPLREKYFLSEPWYSSITYLVPTEEAPFNLYLSIDGFVERAENVSKWTNSVVSDAELVGLHAKEVVDLFKSKGIELPKNSELEAIIIDADRRKYFHDEMLNCVMYRIIERGGNRIGARRAFLFAKEFDRDIDIPMMYGVDRSDPGLRLFINEYIKAGGSKDLECYVDYFTKIDSDDIVNITTVRELILGQANNAATFYTSEENILHQKLVNIIASQVDQEKVKQKTRN